MIKRLKNIPQEKKYGVYALVCPIHRKIVYIGCSDNVAQRHYYHHKSPKYTPVRKYIISVLNNRELELKILHWTHSARKAHQMELFYIDKFLKTNQLLNGQRGNIYRNHVDIARSDLRDKKILLGKIIRSIDHHNLTDTIVHNKLKILKKIHLLLS